MSTQIAPRTTSWSRFLSLPGWVKSVMVGWVAAMLLAVGIAVASDSTPKPVLPPAAGASASPSPTADPAKEAVAAAPQKSASLASADVAITSCAVDQVGYASATVRVTNNSSKPSNYLVTVTFESKDGTTQVATGFVAVDSLQPGQHSDETANSFKESAGSFVCKVNPKDVTRYAA